MFTVLPLSYHSLCLFCLHKVEQDIAVEPLVVFDLKRLESEQASKHGSLWTRDSVYSAEFDHGRRQSTRMLQEGEKLKVIRNCNLPA